MTAERRAWDLRYLGGVGSRRVTTVDSSSSQNSMAPEVS